MEETGSTTPSTTHVIERDQPLSRSVIWKRQRSFFETAGIEAWSKGFTPHWITNNPFIANAYAEVVMGWLRDWRAEGSLSMETDDPVYMIELGTGSGRFGFQFLKAFSRLLQRSELAGLSFKYVMTDFAESNVDFWRRHPDLRLFVDQGLLDFALFDASQPGAFRLDQSGVVLDRGSSRNPVVVVANYAFDSIPQDFFRVRDGRLHEVLITASSAQLEPNLEDPDIFRRLKITTSVRATDGDYYGEQDLDGVLRQYLNVEQGTDVPFPSAGLRCLRFFKELSGGRLLLLAADKAVSRLENLVATPLPQLSVHSDGAFSIAVNFHAMGVYAQQQGGLLLQTAHPYLYLNVCAFLVGVPPNRAAETTRAYQSAIEDFGPGELFGLHRAVKHAYKSMGPEEMLSLLRLARWDPLSFLDLFPAMVASLGEECPEGLRQELRRMAARVWDNYYHMGEELDLPFCLGVLCSGLQYHSDAAEYFRRSVDLYGPDPAAFSNIGESCLAMGQPEVALRCAQQALDLEPGHEAAMRLRAKIDAMSAPER